LVKTRSQVLPSERDLREPRAPVEKGVKKRVKTVKKGSKPSKRGQNRQNRPPRPPKPSKPSKPTPQTPPPSKPTPQTPPKTVQKPGVRRVKKGSKVTVLGVKKGSKSGGFERFLRGFERFLGFGVKKRRISRNFGPRWDDLTRHVDLSSLKPL